MPTTRDDGGWDKYYRVIARIPRGKVSTYSQVAGFAGNPRAARHVGFALAALRDGERKGVPWQRVLGARPRQMAGISIKDPVGGAIQQQMLEAEGVEFDARGRVALAEFGWRGPTSRAKAKRPRAASAAGPGPRRRSRKA